MSQTKRVFYKVLKTLLLVLPALIMSYLLAALALSLISVNPQIDPCNKGKTIFITSNGIHLDIIIPVADLETDFMHNLAIPEGTNYVSFGWGDKDFYVNTPTWADLKFNIAFRSLFLKSESAMHVTCYRYYYNRWLKVKLSPRQLKTLECYIKNSFETDENGYFKKLSFPGYTNYDCFFEARGSFSLFRTCNVWVNKGLKRTGIKTSVWSPFDFGVIFHLRASKDDNWH